MGKNQQSPAKPDEAAAAPDRTTKAPDSGAPQPKMYAYRGPYAAWAADLPGLGRVVLKRGVPALLTAAAVEALGQKVRLATEADLTAINDTNDQQ